MKNILLVATVCFASIDLWGVVICPFRIIMHRAAPGVSRGIRDARGAPDSAARTTELLKTLNQNDDLLTDHELTRILAACRDYACRAALIDQRYVNLKSLGEKVPPATVIGLAKKLRDKKLHDALIWKHLNESGKTIDDSDRIELARATKIWGNHLQMAKAIRDPKLRRTEIIAALERASAAGGEAQAMKVLAEESEPAVDFLLRLDQFVMLDSDHKQVRARVPHHQLLKRDFFTFAKWIERPQDYADFLKSWMDENPESERGIFMEVFEKFTLEGWEPDALADIAPMSKMTVGDAMAFANEISTPEQGQDFLIRYVTLNRNRLTKPDLARMTDENKDRDFVQKLKAARFPDKITPDP